MTAVVAVRQHLGTGLGASEIAAALGLSRWKAPITLWLEKTNRQAPSLAGEPAEWGTRLEPIIRGHYIERHGVEVRIPKQSEYHRDIAWARATVDGYVFAPIDDSGAFVKSHLLEVKAPGLRMADDWGDADEPEVPDYYYVQAVWQMFVTGLRRVDFAVLLGGQTYFERTVYHDAELEVEIVAGATEFMQLVESNTPPSVDATEAHAKYLRSLVKHTEKPIEAPADVDAMAVRWHDLVQNAKVLDNEEKLLKNRILSRCVDLGVSRLKTSVGPITVTPPGVENDYEGLARDFANRLQLRGEAIDFEAELAKRATTKAGGIRRPPTWTKGIK